MKTQSYEIGMVGLGVMGRNLLLNMADHGHSVAGYDKDSATEQALQAIRLHLRNRLRLATTLGYGPRVLHSTGQFHKGGSNTGLFLQLTSDDTADLSVPGQPYTFGTLKRAEALDDLEALRKHERRVIRIHLGADVGRGNSHAGAGD